MMVSLSYAHLTGANVDYQFVREIVTFGPSKTRHTATVSILKTGPASQTSLLSVTLTSGNANGISVNIDETRNTWLLSWV